MKLLLLSMMLGSLTGSICAQKPSSYVIEDTIASQPAGATYPSKTAGWGKFGNPKFGFWFDVPPLWTLKEKTDGFTLEIPNELSDIRIWGAAVIQSEAIEIDFYGKDSKKAGFKFLDGKSGWKFTNEKYIRYVRPEQTKLIVFNISRENNNVVPRESLLDSIGTTMRLGKRTKSK